MEPSTFLSIKKYWDSEIRQHQPTGRVILVGTKQDLRDDQELLRALKQSGKKPVDRKEAKKLASRLGAYSYVECSALTQYGLKNVFDEAMRAALRLEEKKVPHKNACVIL